MSAFSFGEEDVDRHVVVYKKEFVPCPDELNALRKGQAWNPESSKTVKVLKTCNLNDHLMI